MSDKPIKFPIEVELKVIITKGDGEQFGVATIGMGFGSMPADKDVKERLEKFEKEELAGLDGYRLATAPELWDYACLERTGQIFATPGNYRKFSSID